MSKFSDLSGLEQYKIKNHISNLVALSSVDGKFSKSEIEVIIKVCERYGMPKHELIDIVKNGESMEYIVPSDSFEKLEQVFDFVTVVIADKHIDPKELELCKNITELLNIREENINDLLLSTIEYIEQGRTFDDIKENLYAIINH